jgi:hypothetical protein
MGFLPMLVLAGRYFQSAATRPGESAGRVELLMRQAFVWSLCVAALVAGLILVPGQSVRAGDPDIPQAAIYNPHSLSGTAPLPFTGVEKDAEHSSQPSAAMDQTSSTQALTWWRIAARWMVVIAVRPGH